MTAAPKMAMRPELAMMAAAPLGSGGESLPPVPVGEFVEEGGGTATGVATIGVVDTPLEVTLGVAISNSLD